MNGWFIAASAVAGLTAFAHLVPGGRAIARPLLASGDLHDVPKFTHYYCWHIVSIVLLTMAAGYAYCALFAGEKALAVVLTGLALSFGLWNVALIVWKQQSFLLLPQWALFAPIAGLGLMGLL